MTYPPVGAIHSTATAGRALHLFYESGDHYRYSPSSDRRFVGVRDRRETKLPGGDLPLAVAGGTSDNDAVLWAVVNGRTAEAVHTRWKTRQAELTTVPARGSKWQPTQTAPEAAESDSPSKTEETEQAERTFSPNHFYLVRYAERSWEPGPALPDSVKTVQRMWLHATGDEIHFFWHPKSLDPAIHYSVYGDGQWQRGTDVPADDTLIRVIATIVNKRLLFGGVLENRQVRLWDQALGDNGDADWVALPALRTASEESLELADPFSITTFADKLVALQVIEGEPQLGMWLVTKGGPPDEPFAPVVVQSPDYVSPSTRSMRDLGATIIVVAVLLLVLWRRQEAIGTPVALPVGIGVVGAGKRALVAVVDMLPAATVMFWIWSEPIMAFYQEVVEVSQSGHQELLQWPGELLWAWLAFRIMYTVYCTLFEIFMTATPGKRLLGCHLLTEGLEKPTHMAILIRNITRIIELEPYLQIWPFMMVVLLTRNRQRLGDLLARTVLVERHAPIPFEDDKPAEEDEPSK
jgi:uncharacterized RDD family membrane protein YckC